MRIVLALVIVASAFVPSSARAATVKFLGWHQSGAFHYQSVDDAGLVKVRVCREDPSDIPSGWPEGTNIGPGDLCAELPAELNGVKAVDYARKDLKGARTEKKSPFGIDVKLEQKDGKAELMLTDGPGKREKLGEVGATEALKVTDVQWRSDGRAVAVVIEPARKAVGTSSIFFGDVSKLLIGGPAGHRRAEMLHGEGQKLFKKRDWSGAGKLFEEAIVADAEWPQGRYARAAAEAQGGVGRSAMIENLQWLKDRSDKDVFAKKLLAQAKSDPAFDAWCGEPEVRELLGLPKVSTMDVPTRLLERNGTWTLQGATCKSPWLTLAFKKGGGVSLTVAESCKGKKTQRNGGGAFAATSGGPFEIVFKKAVDGAPSKATIVLDESYQQLKLQPENGDPLGPFEPGAARIDDSTL